MDNHNISTNLASHVEAAEKAVATITDPRLREIAFGKILEHFLGTGKQAEMNTKDDSSDGEDKKVKGKAVSPGVLTWLRELVDEGFFAEPKSAKQILEELSARSHHLQGSGLTFQLQKLCHDRVLRRKKQAPAGGGAAVLHWSNW